MKMVHLSIVALIGAISGLAIAIATHDSEAMADSILTLVTVFLPSITLILPWFQSSSKPPSSSKE